MLQRWLLAVLVLFLSFATHAQTSPCAGGTTNPLFTVIPGTPTQLKFEHMTTHTLLEPSVTVNGNGITVFQMPLDVPPPPLAPGGVALNCNSQTVSLGVLEPGTYNVAWNYGFLSGGVPNSGPVVIESHTFSFAVAQTSPCSGGSTNPLFTVAFSAKEGGYRLTFELLDTHTYSTPNVNIAGTTINVTQTPLDITPPPLTTAAASLHCNSQTVSLGNLAPGSYSVVWSFTLPSPLPDRGPIVIGSYTHSFSIGGQCSTPIFTPRIALRRGAAGAWRLRYEHSFLGYVPEFGIPSASRSGNTITILQPVNDVVPPTGGDGYPPPPTRFCDTEEVDLPALGAGTYSVEVVYAVATPGLPPAQYSGGSAAGFIIGPSLEVQCTTTRTFSTFPAMPVAGAKATLMSTVMSTSDIAGTDVVQQGHTLVLTDRLQAGAQSAPRCASASATVGPLETGSYSVQWQLSDVAYTDSPFTFRVVAGLRRHAAH
jgi:hypothetical protein